MPGKIYIGTSGWIYKGWAKTFYPADIPASAGARQFDFYARHFPTVEINASFYRMPTEKAVRDWHAHAPRGFTYAVKGSKAVTHFKKLIPGAKSFDMLLERIVGLREHLGPVLWQLPGRFKKNAQRLEDFCKSLPTRASESADMRHAVEFRDPSWLDEEIFSILRKHRVANVALSSLSMPMNLTTTTDFAYVRFHGLEGGASHDYTRVELEPWAEHLRKCAREGVDAFVYFNNDINTRAPWNAMMLMEMVKKYAVKAAGADTQRHLD